jgi:endonuclease YncB( thermonuclease family)
VTGRWRPVLLAFLIAVPLTHAEEIVSPATRDVTPPGVMPAPQGEGPLVRQPLPPKPPEPARWRRYFLPATTDAATFAVDGLTIHVAGVTPPAVDERCQSREGGDWPCGRTALHALRMFLRGRAVECYFPPVAGVEEVVAPCRVGATDLGHWLLSAGWARPSELATPEYLTASLGARCARTGLYTAEQPPLLCPSKG